MIIFLCSVYETGYSILHCLEFGEKMVRYAVEQTLIIVTARDEGSAMISAGQTLYNQDHLEKANSKPCLI